MTLAARADETRAEILEAAVRAFADRGFEGASTREIAAAAGVHHGLIRHHFGSKARLWQAAVDRAFGTMQADLEALIAEPDASDRERVARIIRTHVHFVAGHPEFVRLMFQEGKRRGPRTRWIADRHVKPLYDAVGAVLARAQRAGALPRDFPAAHFFYVLAGAVGAIFHQAEECRRVAGIDPFDADAVREHARVVERLFLGPEDSR
jgi:AcrR family transcriptional regulator